VLRNYLSIPLIRSIVINTILIIPVLTFFNLSYETRDDIGMMFLAKGIVISDNGTSMILFSSPILGSILKIGFDVFHEVNFYTFFYLSCFFISHVLILKAFILITTNRYYILTYIAFFIIFSIKILLNIQFTIISALMVIVALVYFYLFLMNNKLNNIFVALFFFFIGLIIRPEMALMILIISIPFFFFYCRKNKKLGAFLFFLILSCTFYFFDQKITNYVYKKNNYDYRNPQLFMATYFTDYKLFYKLPEYRQSEIKNKYKWTDNDIEFFKYFCLKETPFFDKNQFSRNQILEDYLIYSKYVSLKTIVKFIIPLLKYDYFILILFILLPIFFLNSFLKNCNPFFIGTLISITMVFFYFYVSYTFLKKSPERMVMSFSLVIVFMILITFMHYKVDFRFSKFQNLFVFLLSVICATSLYKSIEQSKKNSKEAEKFYSNLEKLDKNNIYFNFTLGLNFQDINPFDDLKKMNGLNVYFPSSGADHPVVLSKYSQIKKYDYRALLIKNHFIIADSKPAIKIIEKLLRTHFNEKYNLLVHSSIQKIGSLYSLKLEREK
jgi:hypothetical protein